MNKAVTYSQIADWKTLCKLNIILPVTLSAFTGFVLYSGSVNFETFIVCAGVLLMASSSSILNHIIERRTDALMSRTANRPIPTGRVSVKKASLVAALLGIAGAALLFTNGFMPMLLGVINLLWYSLVYTPLKKVTAFAVVPGSVIGAIPPVIGWTAAGGYVFDFHIILVAFFFFIGQIPHFWMIIMLLGKDYEAAGLKSISKVFSNHQIVNLTLMWVAATAMSAILLVLFGVFTSLTISIIIFLMVFLLLISFRTWIGVSHLPKPKLAFLAINLFYLGVMLTLIVEGLIR
ncbi:MAG: protoheme IX farnesyltransferase [Bacteroidales bacterium]|nr:protoheme IX farnesyltransferase [Bacteroidales bacterium]